MNKTKKTVNLMLLSGLLAVSSSVSAFAAGIDNPGKATINVDRKSAVDGQGYMYMDLSSDDIFTFNNNRFIPGDSSYGEVTVKNSNKQPAIIGISAINTGDEEFFNKVKVTISESGTSKTYYDGYLKDLAVSKLNTFNRNETEKFLIKLYLPAETNANSLYNKTFSAKLRFSGLMTDYIVISYKDKDEQIVERYQSLYDNNFYYAVTGTPALEGQKVNKGDNPDYKDDLLIDAGADGKVGPSNTNAEGDKNGGTNKGLDDSVVTTVDGVAGTKLYAGPDLIFGTADDYYDSVGDKDADRGVVTAYGNQTALIGDLKKGDKVWPGKDEAPGTADDKLIQKGADGKYGTEDDYYVDDDGKKVYAGPDKKFGTSDDRKDLENGTNVERGEHADEASEFGGGKDNDYQDDKHYTNDEDKIPGTADDKLIDAGADGKYGTSDDHYTDPSDNKNVYPGLDLNFGTKDDRKDLGNGTNVERGSHGKDHTKDFGGGENANYQNDKHYMNGEDEIPGTKDDIELGAGKDGKYGTIDDYYVDPTDNKKVYPGADLSFGTSDDRKDLENGTNVERGEHENAADDFGGGEDKGYQNDKHYTNGDDEIPGTTDDRELSAGEDKVYGTIDDHYTDPSDNKNVYPGADLKFDTKDDRKDLGNGTNVERGDHKNRVDEFGGGSGNNYQSDKHYTNADDKIPGTTDDVLISAGADGKYGTIDDNYTDPTDKKKVYPGADINFGTKDDRKDLENGTNVERGNHGDDHSKDFGGGEDNGYQDDKHYTNAGDKIPGTADDQEINPGTDGKYGTLDDHYTDPADKKNVYPGADLNFGTKDDRKDLGNGTNVERGEHKDAAEDFGGGKDKDYQNDKHYTNGDDTTPGTTDDREINPGADGKYGTIDDNYTDPSDKKKVYPGADLNFGTKDDRKDLGNGTNVERGEHENAAEDFGGGKGNDYQDDKHYTNGDDKIPGTTDDQEISKGNDGKYGTKDDYYVDPKDDKKVYPGKDNEFGTSDDRKDLENGTNVERGNHGDDHDKDFGGGKDNDYQDDKHYTNAEDKIPGTDDDQEINPGADGKYGTKDDHYTDPTDGKNVYPGKDNEFGTKDDRKDLDNGTNVERGDHGNDHDKDFGGGKDNDYQDDKHYTNGDDKTPGTDDDREIDKGNDGKYGTQDDHYTDPTDGKNVYPGKDNEFGTKDDRKDLDNGTNVERGDHGDDHDKDFGGGKDNGYQDDKHYTNGDDKTPGTDDDREIDKGNDGKYGTEDDHYTDPKDDKKVYPGPDKEFGTKDDRKDLDDGTNVERGDHGNDHDKDFGGGSDKDYKDDQHYTNGDDKTPGTGDDQKVVDQVPPYYVDPTDGKNVYPGPDGKFGTKDDRKDLGNGTNVERGEHEDPKDDFGGGKVNDYQGDQHYTNDRDKTPGTGDDVKLDKGNDGKYGTADDHYTDPSDGKENYAGLDLNFGTKDDRKDLGNGTNVERGEHENAADEFGGGKANDYQNDKHYTNAEDKIPGTSDDKEISAGIDGKYGTLDDHYTDPADGREVYPGPDNAFGTKDDRKDIGNNVNVERGDHGDDHSKDFGGGSGNNYADDDHYLSGDDKIPGTSDDKLIQKGMDNTYGTKDDFIDNGDGTNLRPGKDLIYGTEDDELWDNGKNTIAGDYDDYLKKYPNRKYTGSNSSGGSGGGSGIGGSSNLLYGGLISSSKNGPTALTSGTRGLAGGTWTLLDAATHKWTYSYQGFTPKNQWAYVYWEGTGKNSWYFFDSDGIMKFGWFYGEDNEWYHLHAISDGNLGAMDLGFFYETEDKQWYYLNTTTGEALTGWQNIDNKWYFFNKTVTNGQTWFWNSDLGRWVYQALTQKPYGAMYANTKTPDGYDVDANGVSESYKASTNAMSYEQKSTTSVTQSTVQTEQAAQTAQDGKKTTVINGKEYVTAGAFVN